jgi:hypothetical protein
MAIMEQVVLVEGTGGGTALEPEEPVADMDLEVVVVQEVVQEELVIH